MTTLLQRKELDRQPAFPKFKATDSYTTKVKKMTNYFNRTLDVNQYDLVQLLSGRGNGNQSPWIKTAGLEVYSYFDKEVLEEVRESARAILSHRAKVKEEEYKDIKLIYATDSDRTYAVLPRLAYSKEGDSYFMKHGKGHYKVSFYSLGYLVMRYHCVREYRWELELIDRLIFTEHNFQLNLKFSRNSQSTIATFRDDKKYQDSELNLNTRFNQLGFRKVEVDTQRYQGQSFDYQEFRRVEKDFEAICDKLPHALAQPELKFRKLGKHCATGLYSPGLNILAVDVRHTTSFIHEYGHWLDFKHGGEETYSTSIGFENIIKRYSERFRLLGQELDDNQTKAALERLNYYLTPTEIFARGFELWVFETIVSESRLLKSKYVYTNHIEYRSFEGFKEELFTYFEGIFPNQQRIQNRFVSEMVKSRSVVHANRLTYQDVEPTNMGIQLSLFD